MAGKSIHKSDICKYRHKHSILIYMEFKLIFLKDKLSIFGLTHLLESLVGFCEVFSDDIKVNLGFLDKENFSKSLFELHPSSNLKTSPYFTLNGHHKTLLPF